MNGIRFLFNYEFNGLNIVTCDFFFFFKNCEILVFKLVIVEVSVIFVLIINVNLDFE